MIDVIYAYQYPDFRAQLEEMHRLRYGVFKERLEWEVPGRDGLERDEFDDLNPIYLLSMNENEELQGTLRLLPTTGPYMLPDAFAELLDEETVPRDPRVIESSRFAVDCKGACKNSRRESLATFNTVTSELFCGVVELCTTYGFSHVVTVHDARFKRVMQRIGCRPVWTSTPKQIGDTMSMYSWIRTDHAFLEELRRVAGFTGSVVRTAPWLTAQQAA